MEPKNPVANDIIHKEIDLIQSCICRMSQKSYTLKGWLMTIIAALLALYNTTFTKIELIIILAFFDVCFWGLNAFYLKHERLYRWKYDWVIKKRLEGNTDYLYDLNPLNSNMWLNDENNRPRAEEPISWVMFSRTLMPFYGVIFIFAIIYFISEIV